MKKIPVILKTLGDLKFRGFRLYVGCNRRQCYRRMTDHLDILIERYGDQRPYVGMKFRCTKCGKRSNGVLSRPS